VQRQYIKNNKILVISTGNELTDLVKESSGGLLEVVHAPDRQQGLDMARKDFPDIIVLGFLEPCGTAFQLYQKLHEGWITRNIPILLVETDTRETLKRVISMEEWFRIKADEYIDLTSKDSSIQQLVESVARLNAKIVDCLKTGLNIFKETILSPGQFSITWEQIPGRGAFEIQQEELIENARRAAQGGKIHAMSVTDNPSGNPAISTEILCTEIKKLGIEPLVHFAFRDKNRNECESLLYGLAALGVRNVLLLTGDYPSSSAFKSLPKPVFDLCSVQGLQLIEKNEPRDGKRGIRQEDYSRVNSLFSGSRDFTVQTDRS
jgi:hypothetical protein